MRSLLPDVRYGLRTLVRAPAFSMIASAVLSIGIGVNSVVFSLANAFFLRPLPVGDPSGVVRVYSNRYSNTRYRTFAELRDRNTTLAGLAGFQLQSFAIGADGESEHVFGETVTGEYFAVLNVPAEHGRLLQPGDDEAGAPAAVVLSHAFWVRRFGASPDVVGRVLRLNGVPFTVVGITPRGFTGVLAPLAGDLWVARAADLVLRPALEAEARLDTSMHLVGRLRPGVAREQAEADLDAIGRQVRSARGGTDRGPAVTVYAATMLHPEVSPPITAFTAVLMVLVGLVLLIVCVNVANLALARAAGRTTELALRQSLGASRARLVRQLLTESLLLSLAGAAGGLAIAFWCAGLVRSAELPVPVPVILDLAVDVRVLAFTIGVAMAATLAFGMAPALAVSRPDLVSSLKGVTTGPARHGRLRGAFLVSQVAMSVLLLVAAGLAIRSVRQAESLDLGFDAANVLTATVDLETRGYSEARGRDLVRTLAERLDAMPGASAANLVGIVPLTLSNESMTVLRDGDPDPVDGQAPPVPEVYLNSVGPGHFETLRIPMRTGRDFSSRDGPGAPAVGIVNETLARRFWPAGHAVGQRLHLAGDAAHPIDVIAVVADSKYVTVGEEPRPFLYRPLTQQYTPRVTLLVRGAGGLTETRSAINRAVREVDPGLAVFNVATLVEATSISLLPARVAGDLLAGLGLFALALAALGIYGVLSLLVRARRREIGVRVAVGAAPRAVAALVVRQALAWCLAGAVVGLTLALGLTRFLRAFLYGVSPTDPLTLVVVIGLLAAVACAAALVPALRAARVDPVEALRSW